MMVANLKDMIRGWFIGNFAPSVFKTNSVEVAVKEYMAGDCESKHHHKIATEYTVVVRGRVKMNGTEYKQGDIITVSPNESTDFLCLEDGTSNVVVKLPGANNDKYIDL